MRRELIGMAAACLGLCLAALPLRAHHSFAAEFDQSKPITLEGAVTRVEWLNPHVYIYLDVKGPNGKVVNWALEGGPPNSLYRQGWRKDSLKLGDHITVTAYLAKDASSTASIRLVTTPDGRKVFAGTADDGGPKQ
jgi:Family of unknown function (DUF6152)